MNTDKFNDIYYLALAAGTVWLLSTLGASADANPAAPLDFLASARSAASSSTMTSSGLLGLTNTGANIVAGVSGLGGLSLAGVSGSKLWKASQDENAREGVVIIIVPFVSGQVSAVPCGVRGGDVGCVLLTTFEE